MLLLLDGEEEGRARGAGKCMLVVMTLLLLMLAWLVLTGAREGWVGTR